MSEPLQKSWTAISGSQTLIRWNTQMQAETTFQRQCMRLELELHVARNRIFNIFNTICRNKETKQKPNLDTSLD